MRFKNLLNNNSNVKYREKKVRFKKINKPVDPFKPYDPFFDSDDDSYVGYGEDGDSDSSDYATIIGELGGDEHSMTQNGPLNSDNFGVHENNMGNPFGSQFNNVQKSKHIKEKTEEKYGDIDNKFEEEMGQLDNMLGEVRSFKNEVREEIKKHRSSKRKGSNRLITEQTSNVTSLMKTELDIIKEKNRTNKTILDFRLKRDKLEAKNVKENGDEIVVNQLFDKLLNQNPQQTEFEQANAFNSAGMFNGNNTKADRELQERSSQLQSFMRKDEASNADINVARGEAKNVTVHVLYDENSGNWEFVALDDMGNEAPWYDLPRKSTIKGQMNIDIEHGKAVDPMNRNYPLLLR